MEPEIKDDSSIEIPTKNKPKVVRIKNINTQPQEIPNQPQEQQIIQPEITDEDIKRALSKPKRVLKLTEEERKRRSENMKIAREKRKVYENIRNENKTKTNPKPKPVVQQLPKNSKTPNVSIQLPKENEEIDYNKYVINYLKELDNKINSFNKKEKVVKPKKEKVVKEYIQQEKPVIQNNPQPVVRKPMIRWV